MSFGTFIRLLIKFRGENYKTQEEFFKNLISNSVIEEYHDFMNKTESGTINKYINGVLSFSRPAKVILAHPDVNNFIDFLSIIFHDDDQIMMFNNEYNELINDKIEISDVNDISNIFYKILTGIVDNKKKKKKTNNSKISFDKSSLAGTIMHSDSKNVLNCLNNVDDEFKVADMALSSKIPENIRQDFNYKILRNYNGLRPNLIPVTKDAYKKHTISFKYNFKDKEEQQKFIRKMQKSEMLGKWTEINNQKVEMYIDNFKDEYYDSSGKIEYIKSADYEPPEIHMSLNLNNEIYGLTINNIILKKVSIENDIIILENINEESWLYIKAKIDLTNYEDGKATQHYNFGIKKEFIKNVKSYLEFLKLEILLNDNKTTIKLIDINTNGYFLNNHIKDKNNFNQDDYNNMNETIDILEKIVEIEELTKVKFDFNEIEFYKNKPSFEVAYVCIKDLKTEIDKEIDVDIIVPDDNIKEYKINDKVNRENQTEYMYIFDKKIEFKEKTIKLIDSTTIKLYKEGDVNHAIVRTPKIIIE